MVHHNVRVIQRKIKKESSFQILAMVMDFYLRTEESISCHLCYKLRSSTSKHPFATNTSQLNHRGLSMYYGISISKNPR